MVRTLKVVVIVVGNYSIVTKVVGDYLKMDARVVGDYYKIDARVIGDYYNIIAKVIGDE